MKNWEVHLKREKKSKILELYDAKRYFNGYLSIKRSYFNGLLNTVDTSRNYKISKGIEKVVSPKEKDMTLNPWLLILIRDNEKNKSFWFLIKREKDLSGILTAIGPKDFAEYNNNNSEAKREIMRIINYIVGYLNKFKCLILISNYLTEEIT